jgi:hypothetical protein
MTERFGNVSLADNLRIADYITKEMYIIMHLMSTLGENS